MKWTLTLAAIAALCVANISRADEPKPCPGSKCAVGAGLGSLIGGGQATECGGIDTPTCACSKGEKCCCAGDSCNASACGCGCGCGEGKKCECGKPKAVVGALAGACCGSLKGNCAAKVTAAQNKDAVLVAELLKILHETNSPDAFLLSLRVLTELPVDGRAIVPSVIRHAERLGLLSDHVASGRDSRMAEDVSEAIGLLLKKEKVTPVSRMTLPSPHYLEHRPRYTPPDPLFTPTACPTPSKCE